MILYIGNKLASQGLNPTPCDTLSDLLKEKYDIVAVSDKKNRVVRLLDMLFAIIKYARKKPIVIIDTYSTSNFIYAFLSAIMCRVLRLRYILFLHGGNLPARLDHSPKLSKIMFKHSYKNVAPSGYLKYEFEKRGYKTILIPNTIDLTIYPFKERRDIQPKLLFVRAISSLYNPKMAIEVLKLLKSKYPDAELCVVGPDKDGSLAECIKLVEDLGVSNSVKFTGKLTKPEWIELSKSYDIFINTTNADNTPVSVMEAMALGMPIITTNVGGLPYLIKDGKDGYLSNPKNAEAMVKNIDKLLSDSNQSSQISLNCRAKAESWGWCEVKNKWFEILESES